MRHNLPSHSPTASSTTKSMLLVSHTLYLDHLARTRRLTLWMIYSRLRTGQSFIPHQRTARCGLWMTSLLAISVSVFARAMSLSFPPVIPIPGSTIGGGYTSMTVKTDGEGSVCGVHSLLGDMQLKGTMICGDIGQVCK